MRSQRLDRDAHPGEVRHPALEHAGERREPLAARREVEDEAVQLVAQEVERRVLVVQDVHLHLRPAACSAASSSRPTVAEPAGLGVHLDRRGVRRQHLPALGAHALAAEEQLAGAARATGSSRAVEQVAHDRLRERVDEGRRDVDGARAERSR